MTSAISVGCAARLRGTESVPALSSSVGRGWEGGEAGKGGMERTGDGGLEVRREGGEHGCVCCAGLDAVRADACDTYEGVSTRSMREERGRKAKRRESFVRRDEDEGGLTVRRKLGRCSQRQSPDSPLRRAVPAHPRLSAANRKKGVNSFVRPERSGRRKRTKATPPTRRTRSTLPCPCEASRASPAPHACRSTTRP